MVNTHTVFVYGSLKKGFGNHHLLEDAEYVGKAETVSSNYTMYNLGAFPGVKEGGTTCITGEVYKVTDDELVRLHRLEGHPTFYEAKTKQVKLTERIMNNYMEAYIYILQSNTRQEQEIGGTW